MTFDVIHCNFDANNLQYDHFYVFLASISMILPWVILTNAGYLFLQAIWSSSTAPKIGFLTVSAGTDLTDLGLENQAQYGFDGFRILNPIRKTLAQAQCASKK